MARFNAHHYQVIADLLRDERLSAGMGNLAYHNPSERTGAYIALDRTIDRLCRTFAADNRQFNERIFRSASFYQTPVTGARKPDQENTA